MSRMRAQARASVLEGKTMAAEAEACTIDLEGTRSRSPWSEDETVALGAWCYERGGSVQTGACAGWTGFGGGWSALTARFGERACPERDVVEPGLVSPGLSFRTARP